MTRKTSTTAELAWNHAVHDIPESGLSTQREATPDELARIARALDLIACAGLNVDYTIVPTVGGHYGLSGRLRAEVSAEGAPRIESTMPRVYAKAPIILGCALGILALGFMLLYRASPPANPPLPIAPP